MVSCNVRYGDVFAVLLYLLYYIRVRRIVNITCTPSVWCTTLVLVLVYTMNSERRTCVSVHVHDFAITALPCAANANASKGIRICMPLFSFVLHLLAFRCLLLCILPVLFSFSAI